MNTTVNDLEEESQRSVREGPGHRLKSLREARSLSLSRVSVLLHLSEEMLTALEADDYSKLPSPVFIQGYLRNYARLLDVPVEPVLSAYHAASPESSRMPDLKITQVRHQPGTGYLLFRIVVWTIGIGLILLSVVWWRGDLEWPLGSSLSPDEERTDQAAFPEEESMETDPVQTFPELEVSEDGAVTLALPQASSEPSPASDGSEASDDRTTAVVSAPSADSSETVDMPKADAGSVQPPVIEADKPQVVIEFNGTSWTKIEDASGSYKVEGSNSAGSRRILQGEPPYRLVLGNARAVKIYVNGREFDITPYNRGDVARFTLDPEKLAQ